MSNATEPNGPIPSQPKRSGRSGSRDAAMAVGPRPGPFVLNVDRVGWLVSGLMLVFIGHLFVWQRGFYVDDYSNRTQVVDVVTGEVAPIWRAESIPGFAVRALAWALNRQLSVWLPDHEWSIRAGTALLAGLNGLLLGWLIWRALGSRPAAVAAGWLYANPSHAQEAVLWVGAVSYVITCTLASFGLHLLLSSVTAKGAWRCVIRAVLGAIPLLGTLLFFEQPVVLLAMLPWIGAAAAARHKSVRVRTALLRSALIIVACGAVAGGYAQRYYGQAWMTESRGGIDLSLAGLAERSAGYVDRLEWMIAGPWGGSLTRESFQIGLDTLLASGFGLVLAAATAAALTLTALFWRPRRGGGNETDRALWPCVAWMLLVGAAAFAATLLFPGTLLRGQILEFRMLYFPQAAGCLFVGVCAAALLGCLSARWLKKLVVAAVAAAAAYSAVSMLGYCESYARRARLDREQVRAVRDAVAGKPLPPGATFVPMFFDGRLYGRDDAVSRLMVGVFETVWSARAALRDAIGRADLNAITHDRWTGLTFDEPERESAPFAALAIQGQPAPLDVLVPFALRDGRVVWIRSLRLIRDDGSERLIEFPAVNALDAGRPRSISITAHSGRPLRTLVIDRLQGMND